MDKKKLIKHRLLYNFKIRGYINIFNKYYRLIYEYAENGLQLPIEYVENLRFYAPKIFDSSKCSDIVKKELHNEYCRYIRCKNRIENMFLSSENLFFLTFTIDNKHYQQYFEYQENFIRYIRVFLKKLPNIVDYCFNLDFGSLNDRLHAHAIVSSDASLLDLNYINTNYKIGNLDVKKTYNDNSIAIEKYLNKFTAHSFKDTTFCRVVYSRVDTDTQKKYYELNLNKGSNKFN